MKQNFGFEIKKRKKKKKKNDEISDYSEKI